ncbi:hypothetical protein RO3G_07194 [Rhizopus delemar RA 99-880]|uniref:Uncharacterized protein n=1 Tax=Rhizopus delemar (strain RA 99-880 / ATCC MYA-4621 / FGSC 9543 / NRRL 43880) TaxID=246409 RepID=I1C209_RHIO9|nr:hypothetical protein RO3G_07194 [Rhizopus delemar RA 99-880]|eukprot:EIE82489.1 hypothetical protein RO3G_07194 [Rhizopus delemar RA 99-880]
MAESICETNTELKIIQNLMSIDETMNTIIDIDRDESKTLTIDFICLKDPSNAVDKE